MKKNLQKDSRIKYSLFSFRRFIFAFIVVGFVVTVSFLLFIEPSWFSENIHIPANTIAQRAISTMLNIFFLCFSFAIIDSIRRKINFEIPLNRILKATKEITNGNFKVRIKPVHRIGSHNELDVIMEDLNKMAEELDSNATMKNDFIASVSHEFKTPLSVIHNYSTMLQNPELDEEKRIEYAEILSKTSLKLSELVSNILKLNKLENQEIFPQKTYFNLSEQICESILVFENQLEQKKLELSVNMDEMLTIRSDYDLLFIVWQNLFSNAVKFTQSHGKITITLFSENEKAVVIIKDSGCGMTKNAQKHIFEKFYQIDNSHSIEGNGLGLALVKKVLDILDGSVTCQSEIEKGTEFTVILPIK